MIPETLSIESINKPQVTSFIYKNFLFDFIQLIW